MTPGELTHAAACVVLLLVSAPLALVAEQDERDHTHHH